MRWSGQTENCMEKVIKVRNPGKKIKAIVFFKAGNVTIKCPGEQVKGGGKVRKSI